MVAIYVLELEHGKYYVGKTNSADICLEQHLHDQETQWTQYHQPIRLLDIFSNCDDFDLIKYTLMYMDKYGIDNVRGGPYSSIRLSSQDHKEIQRLICSTKRSCLAEDDVNKVRPHSSLFCCTCIDFGTDFDE